MDQQILTSNLTKEQKRLLEKNQLGFVSDDGLLILRPSTIGRMWFHANYIGDAEFMETYTKRPMAFSRLSQLMPFYDLLRTKEMKPRQMMPQPIDFNDTKEKIKKDELTNVYFIRSVIGGPIKIGKAKNVEQRLKQHQSGSPFILEVIKVHENVSHEYEKEIHKKFEKYRLHGEWFDETIINFI